MIRFKPIIKDTNKTVFNREKGLFHLFVFLNTFVVVAGTFRDDFEDGNLDGWRIESHPPVGSWKVVDGVVESRRQSSNGTYLIIGKENWTNYTISCGVILLENFGKNGIGFIARHKSPMASHHLDIWSGDFAGFAAVSTQRFPGNFRTNTPFPLLKLNKWHQMTLKVKGKTFTFWINNQKVLAHQDEAVKKGAVGLGVGGYYARFDNIEISGPQVPEFTPPTWKARSTNQQNKLAVTWAQIKGNSQ